MDMGAFCIRTGSDKKEMHIGWRRISLAGGAKRGRAMHVYTYSCVSAVSGVLVLRLACWCWFLLLLGFC